MTKSDKQDGLHSKAFLRSMTTEERHRWVKDIVDRMLQAWQLCERKALAQKLGFHDNTVGNWISKGVVPWESIYTCHIETGRSLNWLFKGEEDEITLTTDTLVQIRTALESIMVMGEKMNLISQNEDNGHKLMAKTLTDEVVELLNPKKKG